jgi:hypothetical protein
MKKKITRPDPAGDELEFENHSRKPLRRIANPPRIGATHFGAMNRMPPRAALPGECGSPMD